MERQLLNRTENVLCAIWDQWRDQCQICCYTACKYLNMDNFLLPLVAKCLETTVVCMYMAHVFLCLWIRGINTNNLPRVVVWWKMRIFISLRLKHNLYTVYPLARQAVPNSNTIPNMFPVIEITN